MQIRGRAITISCTNQDRSEQFYDGVLGAERLPGDGYGCSWFQLGSLTLTLMPNAEQPSPGSFPKHSMPILWLEVDELARARDYLVRRKVEILEYHEDSTLLCIDPDGVLIEIWQVDSSAGA